MPLPILTIDAFTAVPFRGNPAAVCFLDAQRDDRWMQQVAAEMNLSETAFLLPGTDAWSLRWFTPSVEVPLCGHGTLASAHALWTTGRLAFEAEAHFDTRSGRLTARLRGAEIAMDLPALPVTPGTLPDAVAEALRATPRHVLYTHGGHEDNFLLELDSEEAVRNVRPDLPRLRAFKPGIIVTARASSPGFDFVSRYFAAGYGIDEDPVTGSAHCSLLPYWAERLGRYDELVGYQASARGGVVRGVAQGPRVTLLGEAVTVLQGELLV